MQILHFQSWKVRSWNSFIVSVIQSHPILHLLNYIATETPGFPIDMPENAITIDTQSSSRPKVLSVTALHDNGAFSVGEEIRFKLIFTDAVFCDGTAPKLFLNTN